MVVAAVGGRVRAGRRRTARATMGPLRRDGCVYGSSMCSRCLRRQRRQAGDQRVLALSPFPSFPHPNSIAQESAGKPAKKAKDKTRKRVRAPSIPSSSAANGAGKKKTKKAAPTASAAAAAGAKPHPADSTPKKGEEEEREAWGCEGVGDEAAAWRKFEGTVAAWRHVRLHGSQQEKLGASAEAAADAPVDEVRTTASLDCSGCISTRTHIESSSQLLTCNKHIHIRIHSFITILDQQLPPELHAPALALDMVVRRPWGPHRQEQQAKEHGGEEQGTGMGSAYVGRLQGTLRLRGGEGAWARGLKT